MTSAPRSASAIPALGPMIVWVNSRTRRPESGPGVIAEVSDTGQAYCRSIARRLRDRRPLSRSKDRLARLRALRGPAPWPRAPARCDRADGAQDRAAARDGGGRG